MSRVDRKPALNFEQLATIRRALDTQEKAIAGLDGFLDATELLLPLHQARGTVDSLMAAVAVVGAIEIEITR